MGGHLRRNKKTARILQWVYWPDVYKQVERFCQRCPECQKASKFIPLKASLFPMPLVETLFEKVALDIMGPFPKSAAEYQYVLVFTDYATQYLEAIPWLITTSKVMEKLTKWISRTGIPQDILADQGTNLMSRVLMDICVPLRIRHLCTSLYHPQTDRLIEHFNRTLKGMIHVCIQGDPRKSVLQISLLLFTIRETLQALTGCSPFKLMYGHWPQGLLDVMYEGWQGNEQTSTRALQYVRELWEWLDQVRQIAWEWLQESQSHQK